MEDDVLVPAVPEDGESVVAVKLDTALDSRCALRDLGDVPAAVGLEDRVQGDELLGVPYARCRDRTWHLAEDLERDREVVGCEHPGRILVVTVVGLNADRPEAAHAPEAPRP